MTLVLAYCILCAAWAYDLPEGNLVIIEVGSLGSQLEKKVADNADLLFSREMRNAVLLDLNGVNGYQSTFVLSVKNVSGKRLDDVSLIEAIPKEIAVSAALVQSDSQFAVLEQDPVIKFSLGSIGEEETKSVGYSFVFGKEKRETVAQAFEAMDAPVALIPVDENDCTGITCRDFNPCTTDYCSGRECFYENTADGISCGDGKVCVQGQCQKFKSPELLIYAGIVIIAIVLLSVAVIYKSGKMRPCNEKAGKGN